MNVVPMEEGVHNDERDVGDGAEVHEFLVLVGEAASVDQLEAVEDGGDDEEGDCGEEEEEDEVQGFQRVGLSVHVRVRLGEVLPPHALDEERRPDQQSFGVEVPHLTLELVVLVGEEDAPPDRHLVVQVELGGFPVDEEQVHSALLDDLQHTHHELEDCDQSEHHIESNVGGSPLVVGREEDGGVGGGFVGQEPVHGHEEHEPEADLGPPVHDRERDLVEELLDESGGGEEGRGVVLGEEDHVQDDPDDDDHLEDDEANQDAPPEPFMVLRVDHLERHRGGSVCVDDGGFLLAVGNLEVGDVDVAAYVRVEHGLEFDVAGPADDGRGAEVGEAIHLLDATDRIIHKEASGQAPGGALEGVGSEPICISEVGDQHRDINEGAVRGLDVEVEEVIGDFWDALSVEEVVEVVVALVVGDGAKLEHVEDVLVAHGADRELRAQGLEPQERPIHGVSRQLKRQRRSPRIARVGHLQVNLVGVCQDGAGRVSVVQPRHPLRPVLITELSVGGLFAGNDALEELAGAALLVVQLQHAQIPQRLTRRRVLLLLTPQSRLIVKILEGVGIDLFLGDLAVGGLHIVEVHHSGEFHLEEDGERIHVLLAHADLP
eukprot:CAMPEP_0170541698 /NCGR_PEP_ID=MMETSP0211-20121228/1361_1 /TAXON_ID=311385 /ORGANISM="Pseudokeronopsis sp., Strain OXSARD2" /LENGTH=602 /DNA_ID=CAMNT_0010844529 /DNA_START=743 /DNA_END=2551 /DNA_ORIENTATION=+